MDGLKLYKEKRAAYLAAKEELGDIVTGKVILRCESADFAGTEKALSVPIRSALIRAITDKADKIAAYVLDLAKKEYQAAANAAKTEIEAIFNEIKQDE